MRRLSDIFRKERRVEPYGQAARSSTLKRAARVCRSDPALQLQEPCYWTQGGSLCLGWCERRDGPGSEEKKQLQRQAAIEAIVQEAIAVMSKAPSAGAFAGSGALAK